MVRSGRRSVVARVRAAVGPDVASLRQGSVALLGALGASLVAGLTLGAITDTLERLPGLLIVVPAAIGMRGHVFGALGSRLGTAIHTGTFRLSRRVDTVVGQNVAATMVLTLTFSLGVALLAKLAATVGDVPSAISLADFIVVSMVGGVVASAGLLVLTVVLAAASVRFEWDLDNVSAPLVTASGDMLTLPALYLATSLAGVRLVTPLLAVAGVVVTVVALVASLRTRLDTVRALVRESIPIHATAGVIGTVAGLTIERRLESFSELPALLVLVPPFLAICGALGGILASRLSTKLHLGLVAPVSVPGRTARHDMALILGLAVPMLVLMGVATDLIAEAGDLAGPGLVRMVVLALASGLVTCLFAAGVVYYGSVGVYRLGLDPDNIAIPLVTSSVDLGGSIAIVLCIVALGLT